MTVTQDDRAERLAKLKSRTAISGQDGPSSSPSARVAKSSSDVPQRRVVLASFVAVALVFVSAMVTVRKYRDYTATPTADPAGMVWIREGQYLVGSVTPSVGDLRARWMRMPGFAFDRRPVSEVQLNVFLQTRSNDAAAVWKSAKVIPSAARSARNVPYSLAQSYCAARHARLPSEAEWDVAARGRDGRTYPWGNEPWSGKKNDISPFGIRWMVSQGTEWLGSPLVAVPNGKTIVRGRTGGRGPVHPINYRRLVDPDESAVQRSAGFRCAANAVTRMLAPR